jgi:hypothetical protein
MIALIGASAIFLAAAQAGISGPTDAFRSCLKQSSAKASSEKVAGPAIEAYLRNACGAQLGTLKSAVVAFRMKNGMSKKAAGEDADMSINDYLGTSVENYQFMADMNKQTAPAATPATPAATPASVSSQPPK